ncbi:methyltransferase domain-containing protein [Streptomyces sp. NBC_01803]|uniref:methyltransferase domain-containing protein n=1 Tax=Streptomyces sp. NBC_01803 TaxID=2975946 RepID=UPI002DDA9CBF|nr:methyltransferase domain-containing protein [Streptomyces sp. NBC_01803]WSA43499.1 methyltransferase domain-containing protein [Streptomyces sp. NBC_01803]
MSLDVEVLHQRLTESLARDGHFPSGWGQEVFERVPRHLFAPETVWEWDGAERRWIPVRREHAPQRWAELLYARDAVVTQVDDGRSGLGREATCSISAPAAVLNMLASLEPRPGDRVLEIGTGSGYHTALLCERVGEQHVTSVEIDASLVRRAVEVLADAGYRPHVVWGDGELGWPDGAPYDRLISTAAVRRVPPAWLEQVRPGGEIVTPWFPNYHGRGLIWLRMGDDGTAQGWFHGREAFMPVRGQRAERLDVRAVWAATRQEAVRTGTDLDLNDLDAHGEFALNVRLPGVGCYRQEADGGWFFLSEDSGSWARLSGMAAFRYGSRDLLAEVATAAEWWRANDRPKLFDFGLTVTKDQQHIWLRSPQHIVASEREGSA